MFSPKPKITQKATKRTKTVVKNLKLSEVNQEKESFGKGNNEQDVLNPSYSI
jgi:hypothetical protein